MQQLKQFYRSKLAISIGFYKLAKLSFILLVGMQGMQPYWVDFGMILG